MTDFMLERTGRISLVDYGWASINGSLEMECLAHGSRLVAGASRPKAGIGGMLDRGFANPETAQGVALPSCSGLYAANRTARIPTGAYASEHECKLKLAHEMGS